ncbi:VOC family protein [Gordonia sinesedis]
MSEYSAPVGAPLWFDLMSSNPEVAAGFYHTIFGWDVEAPPNEEFGGYQNFTLHGRRVAGLSPQNAGTGARDVWSVYLRTDDVNRTAEDIASAGGSVMVPPMTVGDEGTMLIGIDSAGAIIGFWQPNQHSGFGEWGVHGAPYWFECQSKDYDKSVAFYTEVDGVRPVEIGTGGSPESTGPERYAQLFWGDTAYAGIMDSTKVFPPEVPSFWQVYVYVDDVAETVSKIQGYGGTVVMNAEETPYGVLAAISDPFGAQICLGHPPEGM